MLVLANVMLVTNARQVHQVQQVVPVWMACQALRVNRANRAKIMVLAKIAELVDPLYHLHHLVKDHLVHPARPVPLDPKARPVPPAVPEKEAESAHPAHRVPVVQLEAMANQDPKVHLVTMQLEAKARKDPKDHLAQLVQPDPKDPTVHQLLVAVEMVNQDHLAHPAPEVQTVVPASKAHKVHPAIPVRMPNIVLAHHEAAWSTVVALSLFFAISIKKNHQSEEEILFSHFFSSFCFRFCCCQFIGTAF